jgi:diaminopimelate epimerase
MIPFTKMHGIGNDYIYVDASAHPIDDPAALARAMSDRHFGVGADGLILLLPPDGAAADVRMRMFNADGSEAEMCGNGVRCVCKLAHDRGLTAADPMRVQTGAGVLTLRYTVDAGGAVDEVTVDMGEPILEAGRIPVTLPRTHAEAVDVPLAECLSRNGSAPPQAAWTAGGLDPRLTCVSMGNPHAVLYGADSDAMPVETLGPLLEREPIFPNRTNVHFVEVRSPAEVRMRTWERGSGVTLACGTGACAVCVAGVLTGRTGRRIVAHLPGGALDLHWDAETNHVSMTGPAREVFTGSWPDP